MTGVFVFVLVGLLIFGAAPAASDEIAIEGDGSDILVDLNYAFATQLGSGIYRVSGRTVQIYRLTTTLRLRHHDDHGWGLRLRIPATFGFYDFKFDDVLDTGLPTSLGTLAIVPTFLFDIPLRDNWWIIPFAGAGIGVNAINLN